MSARYELIDAEKAHYPIVKMCAWAGVSTSGFYEWLRHEVARCEWLREGGRLMPET